MKRASEFFSEEDKKVIEKAVAEAERATSGEIVPVVATVSGRYDRAEDIFGVLVAVLALVLAWVFFQDVAPAGGEWTHGLAPILSLPIVVAIVVFGFIAGAALATIAPALRLPFIPKREMAEEVERRAAEVFQRFRVRGTRGATGILLYVSLYERMARVLGDDAISQKLDQTAWDEILSLVAGGLQRGAPADGFCAGIGKCGELLAQHFPVQPGDKNELANELRIID